MAKRSPKNTGFAAAKTDAPAPERPVLSRMLGIVKGRPRNNVNVLQETHVELPTFYVELDLSDIPFAGAGNAKRWQIAHEFARQLTEEFKKYLISGPEIAPSSSSAITLNAQTPEEEQKKGYIVLQVQPDQGPSVDMALQRIKISQGPRQLERGLRAG